MNIYEVLQSCACGILIFFVLRRNKSALTFGILLGIAGFVGHRQGYLTSDFSKPLFIAIVVGIPTFLLILFALFKR